MNFHNAGLGHNCAQRPSNTMSPTDTKAAFATKQMRISVPIHENSLPFLQDMVNWKKHSFRMGTVYGLANKKLCYFQIPVIHSLMQHFVTNSKKLQTTTKMWLFKDFKIQLA